MKTDCYVVLGGLVFGITDHESIVNFSKFKTAGALWRCEMLILEKKNSVHAYSNFFVVAEHEFTIRLLIPRWLIQYSG